MTQELYAQNKLCEVNLLVKLYAGIIIWIFSERQMVVIDFFINKALNKTILQHVIKPLITLQWLSIWKH